MAAKKKKIEAKATTSPKNNKRQEKDWSAYQKAIFNNIENGTGHTVVVARAGSGKTSTLVEALYHVPKKCKSLMVAFNKKIAEELKQRAPETIEISTFHSLGFKILRTAFGNIQLDNNKCFNIAKNLIGDNVNYDTIYSVCKTVSLCKGYLIDTPEKIDEIMDKFDIDIGELERPDYINFVIQTIRHCKEQKATIDFDDMIWFCLVYGLVRPIYDRVFIDEAQDLNTAQISMALMACKKDGRICAVGDDKQAIYGFRGADSDAIDNIRSKLNANILPLSVTYRCAKNIVKLAQEVVPDIEAYDNNKDGIVSTIPEQDLLKKVAVGDFVLSRTNAPLIKYCLMLLKNGVPANIQGRDIGANLLGLVSKSKKKTIESFLDWLDSWKEKEVARLVKKHRDSTEIEDKYYCLIALCEGTKTIADMRNNITKLFSDDDDAKRVILSTTHKAKGLERNRVFVLSGTYRKGRNKEETNLWYVAITRAINELYIVLAKNKSQIKQAKEQVKEEESSLTDDWS